jgi:hypothetical protein
LPPQKALWPEKQKPPFDPAFQPRLHDQLELNDLVLACAREFAAANNCGPANEDLQRNKVAAIVKRAHRCLSFNYRTGNIKPPQQKTPQPILLTAGFCFFRSCQSNAPEVKRIHCNQCESNQFDLNQTRRN